MLTRNVNTYLKINDGWQPVQTGTNVPTDRHIHTNLPGTAPNWNGDLNLSKWGPNGDLILSETGTKWVPLAAEMGTKWGPEKRTFDKLTETS